MKKRLKPRARRLLLIALGVMIIGITCGGYWIYREYAYRFSPVVLKDGSFYVHPGDSFQKVAKALDSKGFIASSKTIAQRAKHYKMDTAQVGYYTLERGMSYRTLLTCLAQGRQTPVRVTFNNIRTIDQLAERLAHVLLADKKEFARHFRAEAVESGERENYIARFLPDTYEFYWTATPEEFTASMKENYERFWNRNGRLAQAQALGLTPHQATIVASIVIEETKQTDEMTAVAGVYINRLAKGMPLQADPTVKFAVGDFSIRRVLNKHTRVASPYNTYKNKGLPPGPICVPAGSVVDAVLAYAAARHSWLYFCASPAFDGHHSFAATLSEHNRNASAYHRALNARGIR